MKKFSIIACIDKNGGIGKNGYIPWQCKYKSDIQYFKQITTKSSSKNDLKNVLIMGRITYENIVKYTKNGLKDRISIVMSRKSYENQSSSLKFVERFADALHYCDENEDKIDKIFVIGGEDIYNIAYRNERLSTIYLSILHDEY